MENPTHFIEVWKSSLSGTIFQHRIEDIKSFHLVDKASNQIHPTIAIFKIKAK